MSHLVKLHTLFDHKYDSHCGNYTLVMSNSVCMCVLPNMFCLEVNNNGGVVMVIITVCRDVVVISGSGCRKVSTNSCWGKSAAQY